MKYHAYISPTSGERVIHSGAFAPDSEGQENELIKLYPEYTDQIWDGFGGAVTDSCAYVWSLMPPEARREVVDSFFAPDSLGYRFVRVPIDS